jgi:hypothetical protein
LRLASSLLFAALSTHAPTAALAQENVPEWRAYIASWNLLNFGDRKSGLNPASHKRQLLQRIAQIAQTYHIIFFQEVLNSGASVTSALWHEMPQGWLCNWVSFPSGRLGRQERFSYCLSPTPTYPNGPPIGVIATFDYMTAAAAFTAVDNTQQNAQNVWMRPPSAITITIPRPPPKAPVTIQVYDNHTKPSYGAQARPLGTPAAARANQSVANELRALERNLRPAPARLILGDLNADCASYPTGDRGRNFVGPNWTWWISYGEKTNAGSNSSCAYDRFIGDRTVASYYIDHGIYTRGVATQLNGSRVSDHFPIWLALGENQTRKLRPAIVSAINQVTGIKRKRRQSSAVSGPNKRARIAINGNSMTTTVGVGATAHLYVVSYSPEVNYGGPADVPLTDVRGTPTTVTIAADGNFTSDAEWDEVPVGNYKFVVDVNKDGILNVYDGDIVNTPDQIDLYVYPAEPHSEVVTIGDNGLLRELFSEGRAVNVYGLARALKPNTEVTGYVVSQALLPPGWTNWEELKATGNLDLPAVSVPVKIKHGPIMLSKLTNEEKKLPLTVDDTGHLFTVAWEHPWVAFNMQALQSAPPALDYKPEYSYAEPEDQDPCKNAWSTRDTNFQAVCNVGNRFSDHYGTAFNFVVDVNNNGVFDAPDIVDTYDIGHLTDYFRTHDVLGPEASGNAAVEEYKNFLSAKLNLIPPLSNDATFDEGTKNASSRYICKDELSKAAFERRVKPSAQIGFRLVDHDTYLAEKNFDSGTYVYDNLTVDSLTIAANADVCIRDETATIGDMTTNPGSTTKVYGQNVTIAGAVGIKDSTACFAITGAAGLTGGASIYVLATPEPFSKGIGLAILAGVALTSYLTC